MSIPDACPDQYTKTCNDTHGSSRENETRDSTTRKRRNDETDSEALVPIKSSLLDNAID